MGKIRTVLGDIEPAALGATYTHEHIITHPPATVTDPDLTMDSIAAATRELGYFHLAGGRALVEMTPRDYGRDPLALRQIAAATGVHIICTTGWHKHKFCQPWVEERSIDDLADEMIRELTVGIDDTGVRAGVIKAASSLNTITPAEEKVFRAAARPPGDRRVDHHAHGNGIHGAGADRLVAQRRGGARAHVDRSS